MADYWKSQPRKFCEFCKVWIADNKPSIEFHEKGKKHKEFVQARLSEVRVKSAKKREIQEKLDSDLAAIEAAALKAYQKDVAKTRPIQYGPEPAPAQASQESAVADTIQADTTGSTDTVEDSWAAYQSPDGYTYYYNSATGVSTWVRPISFQEPEEQTEVPETREQNEPSADSEKESKEPSKSTSTETQEPKKPTKKETVSSPYGAWTTVAVYERQAESQISKKPEPEEYKPAAEKEKTQIKFKEKQTPKLNQPKTDFSGETVTFKKRKVDQEKKKRNIRQRTDES